MKNLKMFLFLAFLSTGALTVASCGGSASQGEEATEQADDRGPEYTSDFVCPMHCEGSGSDKAGTCPKCGMAYVENTEKSDEEHDGHNH